VHVGAGVDQPKATFSGLPAKGGKHADSTRPTRNSLSAGRKFACTRREHRCELMIKRALGINSGQFANRIWDGNRTRCGEVPRQVAIALSTAPPVNRPPIQTGGSSEDPPLLRLIP
jgi:hypothetical protein